MDCMEKQDHLVNILILVDLPKAASRLDVATVFLKHGLGLKGKVKYLLSLLELVRFTGLCSF